MNPAIGRLLASILIVVLNANSVLPFESSRNSRGPRSPRSTAPMPGPKPPRPLTTRRAQERVRPEGETITVLPNGDLLFIGGQGNNGPLTSVTLVNPRTGETTAFPHMQHARAWHSASILPDGRVLIFGGIGQSRNPVSIPEVLDPETRIFERLKVTNLRARAHHTATLLTDGRILIIGGISRDGTLLDDAELWDAETNLVTTVAGRLAVARQKHTATLLEDGSVVVDGGVDSLGNEVKALELFDFNSRTFNVTSGFTEPRDIYLAGSLPESGATNVPIDTRIALRFSKKVRAGWANEETIALIGPEGVIPSKVVPCEGGRLVFISPETYLRPAVTYTVSISERAAEANSSNTISFRTSQNSTIGPQEGEEWVPTDSNFGGNWRSNRPESQWQKLPALQAEPGTTAISGQILLLNGNPLPDATLKIGAASARTDHTGRFLLRAGPGHHVLLVDGRTANKPNKAYGVFQIGVDINEGQTNRLPFTIWMPKLDMSNAVNLASPTNRDIVISTPHIPNLELRIPAGSVIRGLEDQIVKQVSITPIPIDRPPYPLPAGLNVPVFFTIQPGGAKLIPPRAQLYYPNYQGSPPGSRTYFWRYDPEERGWYIYGQGTVTANGKQVVPDPGVAIYEFGGIMNSEDVQDRSPNPSPPPDRSTDPMQPPPAPTDGGPTVPPQNPAGFTAGKGGKGAGGGPGTGGGSGPPKPPGTGGSGGDPVDLSTGLFVFTKTDLIVPDVIPINLTRTYRPGDSYSRAFGIGNRLLYDMKLWSAQNYQEVDLVLPSGGSIHYVRISPGTGYADAVYEHTATPTTFYKSTISWNGSGWDLKFVDRTVFVMGEFAPLQAIKDRYGNKLTITRTGGTYGNITQITSPNNRWVQFTYDTSNRITQVKDVIGRTVNYTYDSGGRLWKVTDPNGGVTEYSYDIANKMLTVKDAKGIVFLTNEYDANGRVQKQILADNTPANSADNPTYQFTYALDSNGKVTQTDVTDPRNNITRVTFNASGYPLTHTYAAGRPEAQSITYERQSGSNIILSTTDQLGRKTTYTRDSVGFITQITVLADTTEAVSAQFTYNPGFHLPASITDPLNREISFTYDAKGSLTEVHAPLNQTYTFVNNAIGQRLSASDPLNNNYEFTYDGPDLISVKNPLNYISSRFTDAIGRTLSTRDALGNIVRYQYDALSRITSVKDPLQGVTSFDYDANSNLHTITDARDNATTYTVDNTNKVTTRRDPLLHDSHFEFNVDGSLKQTTNRKGQITNFTYDVLGRLARITYADSSTVDYTFDSVNRLTQAVDSNSGTFSFVYDNFDRVTQKTTPQGVINYTYDAMGRRTSMTVAGQPAVSYTYDDAGRITQITQGTNVASFGYDNANRRTSLTLPNGVVTEYSYNAASQLTALTYKKGANILGDITYAYDADGFSTNVGGSFARINLPQIVNSATYDAANRQTSFAGQSNTFDDNGSLTSDGSNTYTWNARTQLAAITGPGLNASFIYDPWGNRISTTINGITTTYLYDGASLVQEKSGGQVTANLLNAGLDELLVRSETSVSSNLVADRLGSTLALTDSSGALQTEYTYSPFGETTSSGAANGNRSQYTGRENDGTGLYFYRARYYSPTLHRFISEDPIGFAAGPNFYAYAGNSPTNFTDPFGLYNEDDPGVEIEEATKENVKTVNYTLALIIDLAMGTGGGASRASIRFAQRGISPTFSASRFEFANRSIFEVAEGLRNGTISPNQIPIRVIVRDGVTYTLDNRSLAALRLGGVEPTVIQNMTGNARLEAELTRRLLEMGANVGPDFFPMIRP